MEGKDVVAVVVTYNRKALLLECLAAILSQSCQVKKVILIDNASTDGTTEALEKHGYLDYEQIQYIRMKTNTGGSGGFYEGMKRALSTECDWAWIMDDDVVPDVNCLEALLAAEKQVREKEEKSPCGPSFFASAIYNSKGEPMNVPAISGKTAPNGYEYWYQFLAEGIVNISSATFVSILIKKEAIEKCGLPCKDFFLWGDDVEYTTRLTTFFGDAYFVGSSVAIHKRQNGQALSVFRESDPKRIDMFHYYFRNNIITARYYGRSCHPYLRLVKACIRWILNLGNPLGNRRAKAILRGTWEGIIQYRGFKAYIDGQLKQ